EVDRKEVAHVRFRQTLEADCLRTLNPDQRRKTFLPSRPVTLLDRLTLTSYPRGPEEIHSLINVEKRRIAGVLSVQKPCNVIDFPSDERSEVQVHPLGDDETVGNVPIERHPPLIIVRHHNAVGESVAFDESFVVASG